MTECSPYSLPRLCTLFSLGITWYNCSCECALAGYGCLLASLPQPNPLASVVNSGFGSVLAKPCEDESH